MLELELSPLLMTCQYHQKWSSAESLEYEFGWLGNRSSFVCSWNIHYEITETGPLHVEWSIAREDCYRL